MDAFGNHLRDFEKTGEIVSVLHAVESFDLLNSKEKQEALTSIGYQFIDAIHFLIAVLFIGRPDTTKRINWFCAVNG